MDRNFVKIMTESFYNDFELKQYNILENRQTIIQEIVQEINGLMDNLKLEDDETFYHVHEELSRSQQQHLIYSVIVEHLFDKYGLFEQIKLLENKQFDTKEEFITELGGALAAPDFTVDFISGGQYHNIGEVLRASSPALSLGFTGVLSLGVLIAAICYWKQISNVGWKTLSSLNDLNKKISEKIHNYTKQGKIKNILFANNVDYCWKECGLNPKMLSRFIGFAFHNDKLYTGEARDQADCLSVCYLKWTLDQVKVLCSAYVSCLENTGERDKVLTDINIFLQNPTTGICNEYYKLLKKHYEDYQDAIDVIFRDQHDLKERYKQEYQKILHNTLKTYSTAKGLTYSQNEDRTNSQIPRKPQYNDNKKPGNFPNKKPNINPYRK